MENRKIILCNLDDEITNRLLEVVPKVLESKEETKNIKYTKIKSEKSESEKSEESEELDNEVKRCKKCGKKIKNIKHQKKGKNKKICRKCFDKKNFKGKYNYCNIQINLILDEFNTFINTTFIYSDFK